MVGAGDIDWLNARAVSKGMQSVKVECEIGEWIDNRPIPPEVQSHDVDSSPPCPHGRAAKDPQVVSRQHCMYVLQRSNRFSRVSRKLLV
jgi:hypothetical protein